MIKLSFVLSNVGLIVNILGAIFATLGFLATKNEDLFDQASQCWSYNPKLFEALVDQRDKAVLGFLLILIGSVCGFASSLISSKLTIAISERNLFILLGISSVVIFIILQFISRKITNKNINSKLVDKYYKSYLENKEEIQKETRENLKQSAIDGKKKNLTDLSKRLNIKRRKLGEEDFEELVIQKTQKYLEGNQ